MQLPTQPVLRWGMEMREGLNLPNRKHNRFREDSLVRATCYAYAVILPMIPNVVYYGQAAGVLALHCQVAGGLPW